MRVSPRRSSTRTSPASGSGTSTPGPSAGLTREAPATWLRRRLALDGRADRPSRASSTRAIFIWGARYTILAVVIAVVLFLARRGTGPDGISGTIQTLLGWIVARSCSSAASPCSSGPRLRYVNQEYVLTNRRVLQVEGVLNKRRRRQLAREDQRRDPEPVGLRADVRLRRPARPDRVRERHLRDSRCSAARSSSRRRCSTRSTSSSSTWSAPAGRRARRSATPPRSLRPGADRASGCAAPAAAPARPRRPHRPRRRGRPRPTADPDEVTRTLASLADLRDRGAISAEEYEAKKADLLARL